MATKKAAAVAAKIDWNAILLNSLAVPLQAAGTQVLVELFERLKPAEKKTVLVALYPVIDVQLEGLVKKSKTKIDDALILAIKDAIETSAEANDVVLPELDSD